MNNNRGLLGFLFGGLLGAGIALLYAPRSGEKTRQAMADEAQKWSDKAQNTIQES